MLQRRHMHAGPPVSAFQKAIRGDATVLRDHICKEMNELNLERCRCIPKCPGRRLARAAGNRGRRP